MGLESTVTFVYVLVLKKQTSLSQSPRATFSRVNLLKIGHFYEIYISGVSHIKIKRGFYISKDFFLKVNF